MNEQEVRTLLADLAETPAPPSRVSVPGAVSAVRRQARTRTWLATAAASVLVVALAAGTYVVTGGSQEPTEPAPVANAPERFDPLVRYASFGWLPDKDRMNSSLTAVNDVAFSTAVSEFVLDPAKGPMAAKPAAEVSVSLYAAGEKPQSEEPLEIWGPSNEPSMPYAPVTRAPSVNGKPAYWVTIPEDPETLILKWRWAPNAWAEVTVSRLSGDLHENAHRVASKLRIAEERLRFPFHLTGLTSDLRPVASIVQEGGFAEPWRVDLELGTADDNVNLRVGSTPTRPGDSHPNTTVDGHEARHEITTDQQYLDTLFVYDVSGLQTDILIHGSTAADLERAGPDGAVGVFRTITVHPEPDDWTDRPVR
jgi:hypothetical protein